MHKDDVDIVCAGINHQTWYIKVQWRGMDMVPQMLEMFEAHPELSVEEKVRIDMIRRFGYYTTESNGHVSEYVPWYRKRPDEIMQWIDLSRWINGETGGYLRVCTERPQLVRDGLPQLAQGGPAGDQPGESQRRARLVHHRGVGDRARLSRALQHHQPGAHHELCRTAACIEIPGYVDKNGINMPVVGDLPLACAATDSASVRVQQMGMEAAVHGDVTLLKQAMLHDPLVGAVCNPIEVWQMTDEMLVAQAEWLPQYADEIPQAKARLAQAEARRHPRQAGGDAGRGAAAGEDRGGDGRRIRRPHRKMAAAANKGVVAAAVKQDAAAADTD